MRIFSFFLEAVSESSITGLQVRGQKNFIRKMSGIGMWITNTRRKSLVS